MNRIEYVYLSIKDAVLLIYTVKSGQNLGIDRGNKKST